MEGVHYLDVHYLDVHYLDVHYLDVQSISSQQICRCLAGQQICKFFSVSMHCYLVAFLTCFEQHTEVWLMYLTTGSSLQS